MIQDMFSELLETGKGILSDYHGVQQVIVLKTEAGNIYTCVSDAIQNGDTVSEAALLRTLRDSGESRIKSLVCIWHTGDLDIPSFHFRKALLEMNPENADLQILVLTGSGIAAKPLRHFF